MKKLFILSTLILIVVNIKAQTLIATSINPEATANQNQRKIVRDAADNVYVVYTDIVNQENVIKGIMFFKLTEQWLNSTTIIQGKNPTLSISNNGQIHLVYESNDSITKIKCLSTTDFLIWTSEYTLSDTLYKCNLPISDVDLYGVLNIFWIQKNIDQTESLIYCSTDWGSIFDIKIVITKNIIKSITIANQLQNCVNDFYFGINFNQDSIQFRKTSNYMVSDSIVYTARGSQPCITYNSLSGYCSLQEYSVRFLYLDTISRLIEVESISYLGSTYFVSNILQTDSISYTCIDNLAPPVGYSYLFMKNSILYHGFSYGIHWNWSTILDSILSNPIYPSIAYKSFNFYNVDYIWMENNGNGYNIFHKRDAKHIWVGLEDNEIGKDFTITGFPNPFSKEITINISVADKKSIPIIQIYNTKSQLVKVLEVSTNSANYYSYKWNGTNQNGVKVNTGVYIIMCSVDDKKTARKVIFNDK